MKIAKQQPKATLTSVTKSLKMEINQLIEKGLTKVIKKIVSLEKALEKLKGTKQKPVKAPNLKKEKVLATGKKDQVRQSKKKVKKIKRSDKNLG